MECSSDVIQIVLYITVYPSSGGRVTFCIIVQNYLIISSATLSRIWQKNTQRWLPYDWLMISSPHKFSKTAWRSYILHNLNYILLVTIAINLQKNLYNALFLPADVHSKKPNWDVNRPIWQPCRHLQNVKEKKWKGNMPQLYRHCHQLQWPAG